MSDAPEDPRQGLALIRTDLANKRTLLADGRNAQMFTATGVTLVSFFAESLVKNLTGWTAAAIGRAIGMVGLTRFTSTRHRIRSDTLSHANIATWLQQRDVKIGPDGSKFLRHHPACDLIMNATTQRSLSFS